MLAHFQCLGREAYLAFPPAVRVWIPSSWCRVNSTIGMEPRTIATIKSSGAHAADDDLESRKFVYQPRKRVKRNKRTGEPIVERESYADEQPAPASGWIRPRQYVYRHGLNDESQYCTTQPTQPNDVEDKYPWPFGGSPGSGTALSSASPSGASSSASPSALSSASPSDGKCGADRLFYGDGLPSTYV